MPLTTSAWTWRFMRALTWRPTASVREPRINR